MVRHLGANTWCHLPLHCTHGFAQMDYMCKPDWKTETVIDAPEQCLVTVVIVTAIVLTICIYDVSCKRVFSVILALVSPTIHSTNATSIA